MISGFYSIKDIRKFGIDSDQVYGMDDYTPAACPNTSYEFISDCMWSNFVHADTCTQEVSVICA